MQEEADFLKRRSNRYYQLTIGSLFLMAFFQGLHSFFFTLFFWPAVGFVILALYYQRAARQEEQANTPKWQAGNSSSATVRNKMVLMIALGIGLVSLFAIVFSLISKRNDEATSNEADKTEESELEEIKNKTTEYATALQEYNNQNYRTSISIGKKALVNTPENQELMLVLGDDYGALKQNDSSFIWFDNAYKNGARSAYLSHWLGYLHDDKGNTSQAIEFYKDALKQDSSRTQIYDRLVELEPENAEFYKKLSTKWAQSK